MLHSWSIKYRNASMHAYTNSSPSHLVWFFPFLVSELNAPQPVRTQACWNLSQVNLEEMSGRGLRGPAFQDAQESLTLCLELNLAALEKPCCST